MSTKGNRSGKLMADALKEMFDNNPDETAFTVSEIAKYILGGRKPDAAAKQWVYEQLPKARRRLESVHEMIFIPVTDFYFEQYYGKRPPRSDNGALKCVAGLGNGQKTAGIRRLWIGYKNDGMAYLWLRQGHKSGGSKWKRATDRMLAGFNRGHLTKQFTKRMVESGYTAILPDDRKAFSELLPQSAQQKLINNGD